MNPLTRQFVTEARELLEAAGQGLLELERTPDNAELINSVFRSVHTIKGNAGFFEFRPISVAVHAGEDLLDAVRDDRIALVPAMVDSLLVLCDTVGAWVAEIGETGALDSAHQSEAQDLAERLAAHGGSAVGAGTAAPAAPEAEDRAPLSTAWLAALGEPVLMDSWAAVAGRPLVLGRYAPDPTCFFSGDDPCLTLLALPGLVASSIEFARTPAAADALDPYDCNLVLHFASTASLDELRDKLRFVAEQVAMEAVSPAVLLQPGGEPGDTDADADLAGQLLRAADEGTWTELQAVVDAHLPTLDAGGFAASVLRWLRCVIATPRAGAVVVRPLIDALHAGEFRSQGLLQPGSLLDDEDPRQQAFWRIVEAHLARLQQIGDVPPADERLVPLRHAVSMALTGTGDDARRARWDAEWSKAGSAGSVAGVTALLQAWVADPTGSVAAAQAAAAEAAAARQRAAEPLAATATPLPTTVRVEQEKLDKLMDLIGEMVVAKNSLPYLADRAAGHYGCSELAREIKDRHAVINRISQEMQGAIMQVRMMPVSQVLQRFPRVVRDLARRLGKEVQLEISGEHTEADKSVIEALADPLVHLLRNAIDHGIEMPEVRARAGKAASGTVRINAWQDSDQVCIEIADDGGGIDPARIRRKAVDKQLITEERAAALDDEAAVQLIFAAGFSTAEAISDVSGRGVGMDVVRSSVERVGGRVQLSSRLGEGSSVRLSLPLSMAVSHIMTFKVGGQRFGLAIDKVVETLRLPPERLFCIKQQEAVVLRDRLVPIQRMRTLLGLPDAPPTPELAVMVVRVLGEPVGLVIDEFDVGLETIIKPLDGVLAGLPGLTGTALLGDGSVLLVVDPGALL